MSEYSDNAYSYEPSVTATEVASRAGLAFTAATAVGVAAVGLAVAASAAGGAALARSIAQLSRHFEARVRESRLKGLPYLQACQAALEEVPLLKAAVVHEAGGALDNLMARADGKERFDRLLQKGRNRLLMAEAEVLRDHVVASLKEIGYSVQLPRRPLVDCIVLRASEPAGTAVVAKLSPRSGRLELDFSGFRGDACREARGRLEDALRRRGITLTAGATQRHEALQGTALTREVAALVGDTPARIPPRRGPVRERT